MSFRHLDPLEKAFHFATAAVLVSSLILIGVMQARGRDNGQWDANPADVRKWFSSLMQPDNPHLSCCGEADAYWADSWRVTEKGETVAIITDERKVGERPHIPPGTEFVIPNHKYKFDAGNPTGHGVVFIGTHGQVYCYVVPGGV